MITIISAWYNEEFLARIFLDHYCRMDKIIILLDQSTNDKSLSIIDSFKANPNYFCEIEVRSLRMPRGMDDQLKQDQINNAYAEIQDDGWVIIVDADEFIFEPLEGWKYHLFNFIKEDVVKVDYFQMYQHISESALNNYDPPFKQRVHGKRNGFFRWQKPCIVRAKKGFIWNVGHHQVMALPAQISPDMIRGAHWYMADAGLAINRRVIGRRDRMSKNNKARRFSEHNFEITSKEIFSECEENSACERVF